MDDKKEKVIKKRKHYAKLRQQKLEMYRKDDRLTIRVSHLEKKAIRTMAKDLKIKSLSDYVIASSLNNTILKIDFPVLEEYSRQLSAFGNSLNQITRVINEARFNEKVDNAIIEDAAEKLSELKKYYDSNILILQKNMEECASLRRQELMNVFDPEDYENTE